MAIERFTIEAGQVQNFARAIGDFNPVYTSVDAAAEVGLTNVAAPPTFVQASAHVDPEYPLRPNPGVEWFGSGAGPGTHNPVAAGVLHAEQHFEYHRTVVASDVLSATVRDGSTWEKTGRRGGKLVFSEQITEYRDSAGDLVVTARTVGVRTEHQPKEA
jgi:hypothetical protein